MQRSIEYGTSDLLESLEDHLHVLIASEEAASQSHFHASYHVILKECSDLI
jgi:hypothetical protein